jgi:thiamine kinase-like enzyme
MGVGVLTPAPILYPPHAARYVSMTTSTPAVSDLWPLLDYLAETGTGNPGPWQDWAIQPVQGGANNRLYRVTSAAGDFAVKFTIRDARDRAGREYDALRLLQVLKRDLAAAPVLLAADRYTQPVVVQTWVEGVDSATPPATDVEWHQLLRHFVGIHSITPAQAPALLRPAVLNMASAALGQDRIRQQMAGIPAAEQPETLCALVRRVEALSFPTWPPPAQALCRCDPNILNFVCCDDVWRSVDWENSGWGDPAFEIADLMAHPAYATVSDARWEWVVATYMALNGDTAVNQRIAVYYVLTLVWWVARLARSLYEIPAGREQARLVARPAHWQADLQAKYDSYVRRATAALATAVTRYDPV